MKNSLTNTITLTVLMMVVIAAWCCSCQTNNTVPPATNDSVGEFAASNTTIQIGNTTIINSTDTNKLKGYFRFNSYRPTYVHFQLTTINNETSGGRLSVPGPSDYDLQAVVFFNSADFKALMQSYHMADWYDPHFSKEEFRFHWMDTVLQKELTESDTIPHGYPDIFFSDPNNSRNHIWMLKDKLLLHASTQ